LAGCFKASKTLSGIETRRPMRRPMRQFGLQSL